MDRALYLLAKALIAVVQALPLSLIARFGRFGGALAYSLDRRHRQVAFDNLTLCFGDEKSPEDIRALARENFKRIGENYACSVRTAAMTQTEIRRVLTVTGLEDFRRARASRKRSSIFAVGHFGNFELYARWGTYEESCQPATTYRAFKQPLLNRLLQDLRAKSGCLYFERRTESATVKRELRTGNLALGFLADQHGGDRGLRLPFLGHDCSTSPAPAVYALRFDCPLYVGICYRVGQGKWHIEFSDEIVTQEEGKPRSVEAICLDMNRAFEDAVRRDPANWFWVHRRWKAGKHRRAAEAVGETTPAHSGARSSDG